MIFKCEPCMGRGWVQGRKADWPQKCPRCEGHATFNLNELAHILGEDPRTLKSLLAPAREMTRTHFATARRIFAKLVARWPVTEPRRFVF